MHKKLNTNSSPVSFEEWVDRTLLAEFLLQFFKLCSINPKLKLNMVGRLSTKIQLFEHHQDPPRQPINIRFCRTGTRAVPITLIIKLQLCGIAEAMYPLVVSFVDAPRHNKKYMQFKLILLSLNPELRMTVKQNRSHLKYRILEFQTWFCIQPQYSMNW